MALVNGKKQAMLSSVFGMNFEAEQMGGRALSQTANKDPTERLMERC